jgi:formylglycine-generating enzyme required for sulfatase activity
MDPGEGYSDELPLHDVYISPFHMDRYEVTKALWDNVWCWATNNGYLFQNRGSGKSADSPVESVNWYDAAKWCNARSEMESLSPVYHSCEYIFDEFGDPIGTNIVVYRTGTWNIPNELVNWTENGYRLPTEAEWEFAARGGSSGHRFPWTETETITQTNANYYSFGDNGETYPYDVNLTEGYPFDTGPSTEPFTSPVGSFAPNAFGLYDMAGNVNEWCWDWYDATFYSQINASEPDTTGPKDQMGGSGRVSRGGAWVSGAYECRNSRRDNVSPDSSSYGLGLRCVRSR